MQESNLRLPPCEDGTRPGFNRIGKNSRRGSFTRIAGESQKPDTCGYARGFRDIRGRVATGRLTSGRPRPNNGPGGHALPIARMQDASTPTHGREHTNGLATMINTLFEAADARRNHVTFRTHRKLHEHARRWQKAGCPVRLSSIKRQHFDKFRSWALSLPKPLAATTIEATVRDVVSLIREVVAAGKVPDTGRRLRQRVTTKPVPTVAALGLAYSRADNAQWPHNDKSKTPELQRITNGDFWRGFLSLAYVTGLRLGDLMGIEWTAVQSESIAWTAAKTGKPHEYPLPEILRRNLEPLRATEATRVLPVPAYSMGRIRRELSRISDGKIGPQPLRRLSCTQWAIASPEAGRLIHGTGIGVMAHYLDKLRILTDAAGRLEWPDEVLDHCGLTRQTERRLQLAQALKRLPDDRIDDVLRVARAFAG